MGFFDKKKTETTTISRTDTDIRTSTRDERVAGADSAIVAAQGSQVDLTSPEAFQLAGEATEGALAGQLELAAAAFDFGGRALDVAAQTAAESAELAGEITTGQAEFSEGVIQQIDQSAAEAGESQIVRLATIGVIVAGVAWALWAMRKRG